jgi:uncharacterized protein
MYKYARAKPDLFLSSSIANLKMTDNAPSPIHSPLSQSITREGQTVQVEIFENGEGGWLLEVVDDYGNSTVWDDPFPTDTEALDEAVRTIDDEGIHALIGAPSASSDVQNNISPQQMMEPLSDDEIDELDDFLLSDATSDETMMLDCIDGFFTAIVSGPVMLKPSEWLPKVWGPTEEDEPTFDSFSHAERITSLMIRHLNSVISKLQQDTVEPLFDTAIYPDDPKEHVDGEMWAYGYMTGIELRRKNWQIFFDHKNSDEVLRPIYLLGADEVSIEEEELTTTLEQREELTQQIPASVSWIYKFWTPYREAFAERMIATTFEREHPKVGRNDPCPCGSGKKFKKCCGAATVLH